MGLSLPRIQTSLSRAQRKAGRRGSSPVARLYLAKNEAPEEEAGVILYPKFLLHFWSYNNCLKITVWCFCVLDSTIIMGQTFSLLPTLQHDC